MAFLPPAKGQALCSSVCTINYGKGKRLRKTQYGKTKWRIFFLKATVQIRRYLMDRFDRAVVSSLSCVCFLLSLPWTL